MYLSPRTAASSLRARPGRRGDGTASFEARAFGALPRWIWVGSGIAPGTGDSPGSNVGLVAISAAFSSADAVHGINDSFGGWPFVAGEETLREDADRRVAAVLCSKCFRRSGEGLASSTLSRRRALEPGSAQPPGSVTA